MRQVKAWARKTTHAIVWFAVGVSQQKSLPFGFPQKRRGRCRRQSQLSGEVLTCQVFQHTACTIHHYPKNRPGRIFTLLGRITNKNPSRRWFSGFPKVPFGGICDGSLEGFSTIFLYETGFNGASNSHPLPRCPSTGGGFSQPQIGAFLEERKERGRKQLPKNSCNIEYTSFLCVSKCVKLNVIIDKKASNQWSGPLFLLSITESKS